MNEQDLIVSYLIHILFYKNEFAKWVCWNTILGNYWLYFLKEKKKIIVECSIKLLSMWSLNGVFDNYCIFFYLRLLKDTEVKCLTFEPHDLLICTWLCFVFIYAQNPRNKSRWNERIWVWWLLQKKRVRYIQCCFAQFGKWPFSFFFHLPAISQYSYACSSSTPAKRWQNFHHTHPSI